MTSPSDSRSHGRFKLVTAGHHFLLSLLPFREPESLIALEQFLSSVRVCKLPWPDIDAVLIRCLCVLDDASAPRRIPTLVDRYCSVGSAPNTSLAAFASAVEDMVRYACVRDGAVQQAMELIRHRYNEAALTPDFVAKSLGLRLPTLDGAFRRTLGRTITECIRDRRMEGAARLLATTGQSIKEVWAAVGYNHASNFDHHFKHHFRMSPTDFRACVIRPAAQRHYAQTPRSGSHPQKIPGAPGSSVLIVDDDRSSTDILRLHLQHEGYAVATAETGAEGLQSIEARKPDAVLLDYHLGDMKGLQFLRILGTVSPHDAPAVALFSADWDLFDQLEEVTRLGALVLSKLCDIDQVLRVITYLVAGNGNSEVSDARLRSKK